MCPLAALRRDYASRSFDAGDAHADPFEQFRRWFDEAREAAIAEPNAMTLATASRDGAPSARVVLLKALDARGFTFFTNRASRKGAELDENPRAALVFFWDVLERQVRVEGAVERVADHESDAYFASRPRSSRIGAWASPQSEVIADRYALHASLAAAEGRFGDDEVPRPPHWGGYRVVPSSFEFWQGRPSRLHDRLRYRPDAGGWRIERLAP